MAEQEHGEGWAVGDSRGTLHHYFRGGRSLCGKHAGDGRGFRVGEARADSWVCKACARRLRRQLERARS